VYDEIMEETSGNVCTLFDEERGVWQWKEWDSGTFVEFVFYQPVHGVECDGLCGSGFWKMNEEARARVDKPCTHGHCKGTWREYRRVESWRYKEFKCKTCGTLEGVEKRLSFGVYAGHYCDECWPASGYRDAADPRAEFDPTYAGERLEEDY
jgi:hypothetical protein